MSNNSEHFNVIFEKINTVKNCIKQNTQVCCVSEMNNTAILSIETKANIKIEIKLYK